MILEKNERTGFSKNNVDGGQGLSTLDSSEAATGVGHMQMLGQRKVVLQDHIDSVRMHPLMHALNV